MSIFKRKSNDIPLPGTWLSSQEYRALSDVITLLRRATVFDTYSYNDKSLEERVKELERLASLSDKLHEATNHNDQEVWRRIMEFESRLSALEAKAKK